jgi:hypothetical protein
MVHHLTSFEVEMKRMTSMPDGLEPDMAKTMRMKSTMDFFTNNGTTPLPVSIGSILKFAGEKSPAATINFLLDYFPYVVKFAALENDKNVIPWAIGKLELYRKGLEMGQGHSSPVTSLESEEAMFNTVRDTTEPMEIDQLGRAKATIPKDPVIKQPVYNVTTVVAEKPIEIPVHIKEQAARERTASLVSPHDEDSLEEEDEEDPEATLHNTGIMAEDTPKADEEPKEQVFNPYDHPIEHDSIPTSEEAVEPTQESLTRLTPTNVSVNRTPKCEEIRVKVDICVPTQKNKKKNTHYLVTHKEKKKEQSAPESKYSISKKRENSQKDDQTMFIAPPPPPPP